MNRITKPEVQFVSGTESAENIIELAARTCYNSTPSVSAQEQRRFINRLVAHGHDSVLEHASATFRIKCSRACMSQLTRHRVGIAFSVMSQRYVDHENAEYIVPDSVSELELQDYVNAVESCLEAYKYLKATIPNEDARFVLPNAIATNIIMTANFRELRHIIALRTPRNAQWEIRHIANGLLEELAGRWPSAFGDMV